MRDRLFVEYLRNGDRLVVKSLIKVVIFPYLANQKPEKPLTLIQLHLKQASDRFLVIIGVAVLEEKLIYYCRQDR